MTLQVAVKNDLDVFYFACIIPMHVLFTEDGAIGKGDFLSIWKEIPAANERQYPLANPSNLSPGKNFTLLKINWVI